jgi:hypothetical protein
MSIFRSIFGGKSENNASAEPYWLQAAQQKEFMEACRIQLGSGPGLQARQQAHYDEIIEKSKQAGETPGTYTPYRRDDSTFAGLPRVTMADLGARQERASSFWSRSDSNDEPYVSAHDVHIPE